jgi:nitrate reductase gamma subunit
VKDHSSKAKKTGRDRGVFFLACLILSLAATPSFAEASWLVDPEVFHASVHGRTSCLDCHGEIPQKLHPDPRDITKRQTAFFKAEQCLACHDDVLEKLSSNLHGSIQIDDSEKYRNCIACHDPHAQQTVSGGSVRFDASMPRHRQCGACHDHKNALPALPPEDESCMSCHSTAAFDDPEGMQGICLHCHGEGAGEARGLTAARLPLIRPQMYEATPHSGMACTTCHPESSDFEHDKQKVRDCRRCHSPHPEKVAHDAHSSVGCGACHLQGVRPKKISRSGKVLYVRAQRPGEISAIHEMKRQTGETSCRRCHTSGNQVGAAAMILPPKGVLCMPCHAATFSAGEPATILGLAVFFVGMILFLAPGLSSRGGGTSVFSNLPQFFLSGLKAVFSRRAFHMLKVFLLDVMLQRRLFRRSKGRWCIHGLIFYPMVFRFLWGLIALIGSAQEPQGEWIWAMLDKNDPLTAFLFDLTGVMLIMGIVLAFVRGARKRDPIPGVPGRDRIALGLIAAVVLAGFLLEGMRIAMAGSPAGSVYAFLGYGISRIFAGSSALTGSYGYAWYAHAVLTAAFVAYIPFSRLLHVIVAPWVLVSRDEH